LTHSNEEFVVKVAEGKVVTFHYVLKDSTGGTVLDRSQDHGGPLTFLVGAHTLIPGLESRMLGMQEGETRTIEVPANEAYGERDPELIQTIPRSYLEGVDLKEGMVLQAETESGSLIEMTVTSFTEEDVTVDMNHPLAGKDLVFEVEIVSIRDATPEEQAHGHAHPEGGH
jgi:FKBP-type peptidyl-prolyl cis-trans isomerase SlyD